MLEFRGRIYIIPVGNSVVPHAKTNDLAMFLTELNGYPGEA